MPWNQPGGGGGGPWGSGGGGVQPPNLEEMLRRGQERFRRAMPGSMGSGRGIAFIVLAIVVVWMLSGIYRVQPGERGVELLFGKYVNSTGSGLHVWFPGPIGEVMKPNVERTNSITVGYRSAGGAGHSATTRDVPEESLMLTGDQTSMDSANRPKSQEFLRITHNSISLCQENSSNRILRFS